jgi:hypothetical protein
VLLAKVLGLNATQESSLGLVFHFADRAGLPLLDLEDLRAVIAHLLSDEGKAELKALGGLSTATGRGDPARAGRAWPTREATSSSASRSSTRPTCCAWHRTAGACCR